MAEGKRNEGKRRKERKAKTLTKARKSEEV
jgi:hypothetical protein